MPTYWLLGESDEALKSSENLLSNTVTTVGQISTSKENSNKPKLQLDFDRNLTGNDTCPNKKILDSNCTISPTLKNSLEVSEKFEQINSIRNSESNQISHHDDDLPSSPLIANSNNNSKKDSTSIKRTLW